MATCSISLVEGRDGMKILIDLKSDADTVGHEHEIDHRTLAAKILGVSVADLAGMGIELRRTSPAAAAPPTTTPDSPAAVRARGQVGTRGNPSRHGARKSFAERLGFPGAGR